MPRLHGGGLPSREDGRRSAPELACGPFLRKERRDRALSKLTARTDLPAGIRPRAVDFDGAPRVLGFDEQKREVLIYIQRVAGNTPEAGDTTDRGLVKVARPLRSYHDAVATFTPPVDATWRFMVGTPRGGDVICYNDVAPHNTIYRS